MKNRQAGQALILVLILLAIGATMVIPMLQFAFTTSRTSQIATENLKNLYAAEGGQNYVVWRLLKTDYIRTFTFDGQRDDFQVDVCGTPVTCTVIMRAVPGWRGVTLATDDIIKPTKIVSPTTNDGTTQTYTYTITLEQISDITSQGLDAVYDILPDAFNKTWQYVTDSSTLSVDGGTPQHIDDPLREVDGGQLRLRWPASGNFASPVRDFYPGQIKQISFRVTGAMGPNTKNYNWVVLKPWNTLSGAQAPITRGLGTTPNNGMLSAYKIADRPFVLPGTPTPVRYTVVIQNQGKLDKISQIHDYLPSGFSYSMGSTTGITTQNPQYREYELINTVNRQHLIWTFLPTITIDKGQTLYLNFTAIANQPSTGNYYNEMTIIPENPIPSVFANIGVTRQDFNTSYTWNSSPVLVPAYDSETEAGGTTIDARLGVEFGVGAWVSSWQVR